MKENVIGKINNIGRISNVIVWICSILLAIGMVISLIAAVICFRLPEDTFRAVLNGEMDLSINYENLGLKEEQFVDKDDEQQLERKKTSMEDLGEFSLVMIDHEYEFNEIEQGDGQLLMKAEIEEMELNVRNVAILCLGAFAEMGLTLIALCFVGTVCRAIRKCESPFEENVVKKIKNLAIVLLPWSILSSAITSAMEKWTQGIVYVGISIDLGLILLVVVLVYIFKYGAVLQQESDETL